MDNQELLQAIRQIVHDETEKVVEKKTTSFTERLTAVECAINEVKVILDIDIRRDINVIAEGHEIILERLPDPMEVEALDARLSAVETVVKKHSRDIQDLRKAQ